jgi:small-conductance mechanosensitive channel
MTLDIATRELNELLGALAQTAALTDLAILVACTALAWGMVRLWRGAKVRQGSIWFGEHVVDGVMFPVLALGLAYAAKSTLSGSLQPAVFRIAIPILMSLAVIRLSVRVLEASLPKARWVRAVEKSISWIAWGGVVLWVTGLLPLTLDAMQEVRWTVGATRITLRNVVEGTITAGFVMVMALWVSAAIERRLLYGSGESLSFRKMAATLVRAALLLLGLLLSLTVVGIDPTALGVLGGALGVGLGFGLQKIAANYVSGFVVLAEGSVRIGDTVKVDGFEGRITDIRTRYTVIRALNGREAIVPNEMLITQRVENSSLADSLVALQCGVQIAYGSDVRAVQARLVAAVAAVPRVLAQPAPDCQLNAFAADGMDLVVIYWIDDPHNGLGNVRSDVNLALLDTLHAMGVQIPYPQRVVHSIVSRDAS